MHETIDCDNCQGNAVVNYMEREVPYYPVNDEKNNTVYEIYRKLAEKEEKVIFGGRIGERKE